MGRHACQNWVDGTGQDIQRVHGNLAKTGHQDEDPAAVSVGKTATQGRQYGAGHRPDRIGHANHDDTGAEVLAHPEGCQSQVEADPEIVAEGDDVGGDEGAIQT